MTSVSYSEASWRKSNEYFDTLELQLQQRHEEILARRAALLSGKEAYYDSNTGVPELFIGSDAQAARRNDRLFETLHSIRNELHRTPQEIIDKCSSAKKAYAQSIETSINSWIEELKEFRREQINKIGQERWALDEDYQAIDAILQYKPTYPQQTATLLASVPVSHVAPNVPVTERPQLASSVPNLSASVPKNSGEGQQRSRRSRLGAFLSSSWSNLRARLSRSGSRNRQQAANN